ncbi:type II secretion system protein [Hydrogenophaga sp.]|uniref:type II secretion system protein n=1 Tax=Hydrogenophaga sp. TaxID=1904254 RepID=UPI002630F870|nr:type II secretion system protein [Hydrogenophaga sp.]MCW5652377.1 type II secretion system protein [Hydrogenophaga sp.]
MRRGWGHARRARQGGLSLVEASVALAIIGVALVVLWQAVGGMQRREDQERTGLRLARADAAVLAFVGIHRRFPCPAAQPDGSESCDGRASGFFPYRTLGLPEADAMARMHYALDPVIAGGDTPFIALGNDQAIGQDSAPRAQPMALKTLLGRRYDGMLDVCSGLSRVAVAFTLVQREADGPGFMVAGGTGAQAVRAVAATTVSGYLGCAGLVAVAGRGQYNAHLASAILGKAVQDHRMHAEVGYALDHWNLAEGIWSFANGMYAAMKNWAKLAQTASALDAHIWSNPVPFLQLNAKAIVDRTVELVGVAARMSDMIRNSRNLALAQDSRRTHNALVARTLALYTETTRHALIGSSSAYFLSMQDGADPGATGGGQATDYGLNGSAQDLASRGETWAGILGHADLMAPYTRLPAGPALAVPGMVGRER